MIRRLNFTGRKRLARKDVTIRLQAASKVCGSTTGEDNGTTTKTYVYFRFGDVSVKYF